MSPKGLQNHQTSRSYVVKREKVKSYIVREIGRLAKGQLKSGFGTRFGKIFFKPGKLRRLFRDRGMQKHNFSTFARNLSRNATFFALNA